MAGVEADYHIHIGTVKRAFYLEQIKYCTWRICKIIAYFFLFTENKVFQLWTIHFDNVKQLKILTKCELFRLEAKIFKISLIIFNATYINSLYRMS